MGPSASKSDLVPSLHEGVFFALNGNEAQRPWEVRKVSAGAHARDGM